MSLKIQEVEGTAEEKIPFEFMKLHHCIVDYDYDGAIIVLSGDTGWSWKDYFLSKEFKDDMKKIYPDVQIMSEEEFYRLGAKAPRSNCLLDNSKLLSAGVKIRDVSEALEDSLRKWT